MKILKPDDHGRGSIAYCDGKGQDRLCVGPDRAVPAGIATPRPRLRPETELWQRLPQAPGGPGGARRRLPQATGRVSCLYGEACAPGGKGKLTELAVRGARGQASRKPLIVRGRPALERARHAVGGGGPFTRHCRSCLPHRPSAGPGDESEPRSARPHRRCPTWEDPRQSDHLQGRPSGRPAGLLGRGPAGAPQRQRPSGRGSAKPWLQKDLAAPARGHQRRLLPERAAGPASGRPLRRRRGDRAEPSGSRSAAQSRARLPRLARGRCFALRGKGPARPCSRRIETPCRKRSG